MSDPAAALHTFFEARLPGYLDLLKRWVVINSFTANRAGVNALGERTAADFAPLGFACDRIPSENPAFGDHLVLTRPGRGSKKIGLVSHLDTVFPPDEETANDFLWRPADDRIYGPGTVDIKGGTLMVYMILDALRALHPEAFESVTWVVLLDASEETLSEDFGRICLAHLAGAAACLVFEGGFFEENTFKLVQMRKGMAKFRIRAEGRAAHAGVAHADGVNALVGLSEAIAAIAGFTDYARNLTFNVGYANGGTVPNRVPHFAEALGEMRAFEMDVFHEGLDKLRTLEAHLASGSGQCAGCRVSIEIGETTAPWPRNPDTDHLIRIWQAQAERLGWRVDPEARGGLSDGNHTWSSVPTVDGLGPMGGNAHCSEHNPDQGKIPEYLYVPSLVPKGVLNVLGVLALLAVPHRAAP